MLSIIVPTLNEERLLAATLLGIKKLTDLPFELIVADSGSTDGTLEIARRYADKVVAYDDPPHNAARGRNLGASIASGELLVFIDADITVDDINRFFRTAVSSFQDPALVSLMPRVRVLPRMRTLADRISYFIYLVTCYTTTNIFNWGVGSAELMMIRTHAFRTVGGFDESMPIAEDIDLYGRLRSEGKVRMFPSLLVMNNARRARKIGWLRLWREWILNGISVRFHHRSWGTRWTPIR